MNQSAAFADAALSEDDLDLDAVFESAELLEVLASDDLVSDAGFESPDGFAGVSLDDALPFVALAPDDSDVSLPPVAAFFA